MKQEEETDTFRTVLFCCRKLRDSRSDSRSYRSQSGHFLRDGKPQLPAHGAAAGCRLHPLLWSFIAAAGAAAAPRHGCKGPGTPLPQELLKHSVCSRTSPCLGYEQPHGTRSTGRTIAADQRRVAEHAWIRNGAPAARLLGEIKQLSERLPKTYLI